MNKDDYADALRGHQAFVALLVEGRIGARKSTKARRMDPWIAFHP